MIDAWGWLHALLGVVAFALGLRVVLRRKGTRSHRRTGRLYVAAMLLLNLTALSIYDLFGFFGPFHVAAVISLATLAAGLYPMYFARHSPHRFELHAWFMAWSYGGLVAAAVAEVAVRVPGIHFGAAAGGATVLALSGAALIIHTRVPNILRGLGLGGRHRSGSDHTPGKETSMDPHPGTDDLAVVRQLMEERAAGVHESGTHYVLWGLVIAAGLVLTYGALGRAEPAIPWIWGTCLAVGWIAAWWLGARDAAEAPVVSLVSRTRTGIWVGCGVGMSILGLLGYYTGAVRPGGLPGVIAVVMGVGYFASSFAYRSRAMRVLGGAWWLSAVGLFLWPGPHALLVLAGLLVAFQVVPGVVFYRRARALRAASGT